MGCLHGIILVYMGYNVITVNISVLFVAIKRAVLLQVISKWLDSKGFALFLNCSDNV